MVNVEIYLGLNMMQMVFRMEEKYASLFPVFGIL